MFKGGVVIAQSENGKYVGEIQYVNNLAQFLTGAAYFAEPNLSPVQRIQLLRFLSIGGRHEPEQFLRSIDEAEVQACRNATFTAGQTIWHFPNFPSMTYVELCRILSALSEQRIYDSNVRFHHMEKKLAIYGLDGWVEFLRLKLSDENNWEISLDNCKIRLLISPGVVFKSKGEYDFTLKDFRFFPFVIPRIISNQPFSEGDFLKCQDALASELVRRFAERLSEMLGGNSLEYKPYESVTIQHLTDALPQFVPRVTREKCAHLRTK